MYKAGIRADPHFLKRIKYISCPFKVLSNKRDLTNSKSILNNVGVKSPQQWYTRLQNKQSKQLSRTNTFFLCLHQHRRCVVKFSKSADQRNAAALAGSVRGYSGNSDEKKNVGKKKAALVGNKEVRKDDSKVVNQGKKSQRGEKVFHTKNIEKQNADQDVPSENKGKLEELQEAQSVPCSKNLEDFDKLQVLKGKLIRRLGLKWISHESITETLENFPYYISEPSRDMLIECVAARLKKPELSKFGESLPCSSNLILLQGQHGTELYQEKLVKAIAHHLKVSLVVLDSGTLTAKDLKDEASTESPATTKDRKNCLEENIIRDLNEETSSLDSLNQMFGRPLTVKELRNLKSKFSIPLRLDRNNSMSERANDSERVRVDIRNWEDELKKQVVTSREEQLKKLGKQGEELKKYWHDLIVGDHVRYKGPKTSKGNTRLKVRIGQEGFVSSISDGLPWKVCVQFQSNHGSADADEVFCDATELEKIDSSSYDEAWLARFPELPIEALCKMILYRGPVIVYFPDFHQWFSSALMSKGRSQILKKVKDLLSKIEGPVVFIATQTKAEAGKPSTVSKDPDTAMPEPLFVFDMSSEMPTHTREDDNDSVFEIFKNIIKISPPEDPHLLRAWQKQLEDDKKSANQERNYALFEESLLQHGLCCHELADVDTSEFYLTPESVEDVIGWARNMTLHNKIIKTNNGKLVLGKASLEKSLMRLKALKITKEEKSHIKDLAENEYEKSLVPSVILAHDIGVRFDEIGALDDVKATLKDLIVLPFQRPELFRKGNLKKPCKGVLLFGPPGTGKTLIAKAVATEAGANFINVSASSITSKFYGDDEKLVKALFTFARKLSPVVIFIDEVDSLLGARGGSSEHEASRRIKNEFMACWDGLHSNDNEQILVFATTNRPFDLDDAVIRRLPRRLLVDLPNAENRGRILRILLGNEDLDDKFDYDVLAAETEGYSGSDLKNLCVAAAYIPIREFLAYEKQSGKEICQTQRMNALRPLCLEDFMQAKSKIGASVAYDAASMIQLRRWNEQYGEGGKGVRNIFGFT